MAKTKSTNTVKQPPAVATKSKSPGAAKKQSPAPIKKSPAAASLPAISTSEIGRVAGDVWGLLVSDGGQTLAAIKKSIDAPADVVAAAIGWLAREDKLEFSMSGRQVKVSLR